MREIETKDLHGLVWTITYEVRCGRCDKTEDYETGGIRGLKEDLHDNGWIYDDDNECLLCYECAETFKDMGLQTTDQEHPCRSGK